MAAGAWEGAAFHVVMGKVFVYSLLDIEGRVMRRTRREGGVRGGRVFAVNGWMDGCVVARLLDWLLSFGFG